MFDIKYLITSELEKHLTTSTMNQSGLFCFLFWSSASVYVITITNQWQKLACGGGGGGGGGGESIENIWEEVGRDK